MYSGSRMAWLQSGSAVVLLAENRPAWIVACLAVLKAGAVVVPLDVQFDDAVLRHVLHDSGARTIFTTTPMAHRLEHLAPTGLWQPWLLDVEADDERSWRHLLVNETGALPEVVPDDPATLFSTSGTTGPPKGVPLSHRGPNVFAGYHNLPDKTREAVPFGSATNFSMQHELCYTAGPVLLFLIALGGCSTQG